MNLKANEDMCYNIVKHYLEDLEVEFSKVPTDISPLVYPFTMREKILRVRAMVRSLF